MAGTMSVSVHPPLPTYTGCGGLPHDFVSDYLQKARRTNQLSPPVPESANGGPTHLPIQNPCYGPAWILSEPKIKLFSSVWIDFA